MRLPCCHERSLKVVHGIHVSSISTANLDVSGISVRQKVVQHKVVPLRYSPRMVHVYSCEIVIFSSWVVSSIFLRVLFFQFHFHVWKGRVGAIGPHAALFRIHQIMLQMIQVPGTGWPNSVVGSQGVTTTFLFTQTSSWLVKVCLTLWWTPSLRHVHFHRQVFKSLFLHRKVPNNWSAVAVLPVQHSAWCPVVHDQRRCCRKWSLMRKSSEKSGKYQWPKIWQIWVIWIWEFGIWLTYHYHHHHHIIFIFSLADDFQPAHRAPA